MDRSKKRIPIACIRCRKQKARCILSRGAGDIRSPPCQKCVQAGVECILATSNRGGARRRRTTMSMPVDGFPTPAGTHPSPSATMSHGLPVSDLPIIPDLRNDMNDEPSRDTLDSGGERGSIENTLASASLHNTSTALNLLSQLADNLSQHESLDHRMRLANGALLAASDRTTPDRLSLDDGLLNYDLVKYGILTIFQVSELLERFGTIYHPYYPIAPPKVLRRERLAKTAKNETTLLTAMITIAAKDNEDEELLRKCFKYMEILLSEIIAGKRHTVEAVEALLLLAEWEPQCLLTESGSSGCGREDVTAWMHVGLALRLASILKLDRLFLTENKTDKSSHSRQRLAWIACFLSDRQISVRIGRPFGFRGSLPHNLLGSSALEALISHESGEDDHASVIRARLELTQIFSNVHEILYCNIGSSMRTMLLGSYVNYIDDFQSAIRAWKSLWGPLTVPSHIKVLLDLSYEYLRLYTNAFAFQAMTFRALSTPDECQEMPRAKDPGGGPGLLPDARFVYESVDAAKSLLTIINNYIPSGEKLREFPIRFPLYAVNASVFLYKAWSLKVISAHEKKTLLRLVHDTTSRLRRSSIRPSDLGARYAQLLDMLWERTENKNSNKGTPTTSTSDEQLQRLVRPQERPQNLQDGFSWLDLEALGEYVGKESPNNISYDLTNAQNFMEPSGQEGIVWNDNVFPLWEDLARIF